jgi:phage shock protein A
MTFFHKLFQQVSGAANDTLDAVSSNSVAVRQSVRDMQVDIEKATAAVADVNAQKTLITNRIADAHAAAADWGNRAARAVSLGDDSLASSALEQQVAEEARVAKYQAQLDELTPQAAKLNQLLTTRKEQLENAKIDSDVIQANDAVASATQAAAKSLSPSGNAGSLQAAKDAVAKKSATANALLELNEDAGAATERKLRELETNSNVGDRLAALKKVVATQSSAA